jgi:activating signal cointegrator complex subunit 3
MASADKKMRISLDPKLLEKQRELFKNLYTTAISNNAAQLDDPSMALHTLQTLLSDKSSDEIQNELLELLGFENIEVVGDMIMNRDLIKAIASSTHDSKPGQFQPSAIVTVSKESDRRLKKVIKKSKRQSKQSAPNASVNLLARMGFSDDFLDGRQKLGMKFSLKTGEPEIDYSGDAFQAKALPSELYEVKHTYYNEFVYPAPLKDPYIERERLDLSAIEEYFWPAFKGTQKFNPMQTRVFEMAYMSDSNILICAPTGAGKTNIALLCIMRVIKSQMDEFNAISGQFKIIYVAPMKALAAEVTSKFSDKLKYLGIQVRELTGDVQLSRNEMAKTHIIVTTPEKWDVVTRKTESIASQVKLLILDEIHLLDDERGPVLESIVARTKRQVESSQSLIRIVGLSATLPNYKDVGIFVSAPDHGIFAFDGSYRPVPLEQRFVGIKVVANTQKQQNMMLEAVYEKVLEQVKNEKQVLIFVHSRRDTIKTAEDLRLMAINSNQLEHFEVCYSLAAKKEVEKSKNKDLRFLFEAGFGIHNAGMLRKDRTLTENLFRNGQVKVLVTTATLAWGVNLPAHAVIIKGTEIYDASVGGFKDVGVLDVQQIFGRAGRPDYDTSGVAVIMTTANKLPRYLDMLVNKAPIESKFLSNLADALNAEIALGTVQDIWEALRWFQYTYCYVRMHSNHFAYGIDWEERNEIDTAVVNKLRNAANQLHNYKMIKYNPDTEFLSASSLGRISSNYYIKAKSIEIYNEKLYPFMTDEELLFTFSESHEFKQLKMREEEEAELQIMRQVVLEECNIKLVDTDMATNYGKVTVLLFAYLCKYTPDTFSLVADQAYVIQNGARIMRALFEISLTKLWSLLADKFLDLSKRIDKRINMYDSPLLQFSMRCNTGGFTASTSSTYNIGGYIKDELLFRISGLNLHFQDIKEMPLHELSSLLHHESGARDAKKFADMIPTLEVDYTIHPITGNIVKFSLILKPTFNWRDRWHGPVQGYWIWVDNGTTVLHHEHFQLHKTVYDKKDIPSVTFAVPIHIENGTDYYNLRIHSDHWVGADTIIPIHIGDIPLPEEEAAYTELLDLTPLPKTALSNPAYESLCSFNYFNPVQTQAFHSLYHHDTNVLVGAPTGSGKTVTAEIAMFRLFNHYPEKKVIYIAPLKALAKERLRDWRNKLSRLKKSVVELSGDFTPDIKALLNSNVIITTPEKWDGISRNWQHRSYVQDVGLVIIDEIHLLGQERGPVLEVIVSRMRYIASQTKNPVRIIGLSTALSNSVDLANWLGIEKLGFFNFKPSVRPVPIQSHISGFTEKAYCPRMASMNKPAYKAIKTFSGGKPVLIFVSSRRQTRLTAFDLIAYCHAEDSNSRGFLNMPIDDLEVILTQVKDNNLKHALYFGIGMHHAGLIESDRSIVEELFLNQKIQILVTTTTLAWGVNFPARLVIIKGTEFFDAKEKRYLDYPVTDVLQMMGRAGRPQFDDTGIVCIYALQEKVPFLKTFLFQPFPVESSLAGQLPDHINAEISAGTLTTRASCINYLTWTYYFRRLTRNPAYYGLSDNTVPKVNEFLNNLIDSVLRSLSEAKCISIEEDGYLEPTPIGHTAAFYYLTHQTVKLLNEKLSVPKHTFEELIKLLSDVKEFDELPVRHNEDQLNEELSKCLPLKVDMRTIDSPHTKTYLLFQAHFSQAALPITDYITDTKLVLDQSVRIIQGMVDICALKGSLSSALKVMNIGQMIAQGMWYYDSTLINLPGLKSSTISNLFSSKYSIRSLAQLIEMDNIQLNLMLDDPIFNLSASEKEKFFKGIKAFPVLSVAWHCKESQAAQEGDTEDLWGEESVLVPGNVVDVHVKLSQENPQASPRPVFTKLTKGQEVGYWLVVGCKFNDTVLAVKRIPGMKSSKGTYKVTINVPENPSLALFVMCDSYMGIDQECELSESS